jgi:hypothetical protein
MLIFLNPRQSLLQAQIVDPDGFRRRKFESAWEIELAAELLKGKLKPFKRKKRKEFNFKELLNKQLNEGATVEAAVEAVANEALNVSPTFEYTAEIKAQVDAVVAEYYAKIAQLEAIKVEQQRKLQAEQQAYVAAIRQAEIAENKRKKRNAKTIKVLLMLASMEDDE